MSNEDVDLKVHIGRQIKKLRTNKKMRQSDLAAKIKKSNNTISNYEKGIIAPSQNALMELAKALDCSVDDFFPVKKGDIIQRTVNLTTENTTLSIDELKYIRDLGLYLESLDVETRKTFISNMQSFVNMFK